MAVRNITTDVSTSNGYKTVSGTKRRLFRFEREPLVDIGDLLVDPTGLVADPQAITYIGAEGVGYDFDFAGGNEDVFTTENQSVTFQRTIPERTYQASDRAVQNKLIKVASFLGMRILKDEQPTSAPEYQGTRTTFEQTDSIVEALEKLDDANAALTLDPDPTGVYTDIDAITVNSKGQIVNVTTIPSDPDFVQVRRTFLSKTPTVVANALEVGGNSWAEIDLSLSIPTTAKAAILYITPTPEAESGGSQILGDRRNVSLVASPNGNLSNAVGIVFDQGGEDSGGGRDPFGGGNQFVCRVINRKLYVKDNGNLASNYPSDTWQWTFTLVGYSA